MASEAQQNGDSPLDFAGQQVPTQLGPFIKWGAVLVALILLFVLLSFLRSIYTDLLWFNALGFKSVFVKTLTTRIVLFVIGAVLFAVPFGISLYICRRLSGGPIEAPMPEEVANFLRKATFWGIVAAVIIVSVIFGSIFASRWEMFLRYSSAVSFGEVDPVFGKDLSFYMFTLPTYSFVQGWALGAAIMVLVGTLALYFVNYSLRGVGFQLSNGLKIHVSILGAIILFVVAGGHWLDRWELLLSGQGAVFGAAYTDLHARKPALFILTIIASASGILMLVNAYLRGVPLLLGALALWIVMAIALGAVWPAIMQQFSVNPNEFVREGEYIARNMELTRRGFALDRTESAFFPSGVPVTAELVRQNPQTINNIRLWDSRPLSDVYTQIQLIRPYYDFRAADVDRYTLDGQYRQVLLAAREVAPEKLEEESQTWLNTRLFYTHGIGLAMSPVTEFTPEGRPVFFAKDIPADGVIPIQSEAGPAEPDLLVTNPRIYYGENTVDYVIANTNTDELDYQTEEGELVRTSYFGEGGVRLGSFFRRLAYAWQFADINIAISGELTSDSQIQYRRAVQERISTVAPFLLLDEDPYIVAAEVDGEGKLFWVQDAYTTSDQFPYSDPTVVPLGEDFNYIRNSVKVTIDAYNGTLRFYIWDPDDPIIKTYANIFPDLFVPMQQMPDSLQQHVRYPQDFFTHQAEKYLKYHMKEPLDFYNNEDLWAFPNEKFGQSDNLQRVEPYFVIMKLPGEESEEFVQLLPYTPNQRQNLIGWLAARSDGENYGKLLAFEFPKDRQVDGPEQVEARIDNDQNISAWFTLRCAQGSICIRGNLLVIPVGDAILYAEPVYIQAEGVRFPELKRVILATGEKVVMEDSLAESLAELTRVTAVAATSPDGEEAANGELSVAPSGTVPVPPELQELVDVVKDLKQDLALLEQALERLRVTAGGE